MFTLKTILSVILNSFSSLMVSSCVLSTPFVLGYNSMSDNVIHRLMGKGRTARHRGRVLWPVMMTMKGAMNPEKFSHSDERPVQRNWQSLKEGVVMFSHFDFIFGTTGGGTCFSGNWKILRFLNNEWIFPVFSASTYEFLNNNLERKRKTRRFFCPLTILISRLQSKASLFTKI